jgi:hypothetical protein
MLFDISIMNRLSCGIEGACQELDRLGVRWGASRFVAKPAGQRRSGDKASQISRISDSSHFLRLPERQACPGDFVAGRESCSRKAFGHKWLTIDLDSAIWA